MQLHRSLRGYSKCHAIKSPVPRIDWPNYEFKGQSTLGNVSALCVVSRKNGWKQSNSVPTCSGANFIANLDECLEAGSVGVEYSSFECGE
jgi:hypothetical protein